MWYPRAILIGGPYDGELIDGLEAELLSVHVMVAYYSGTRIEWHQYVVDAYRTMQAEGHTWMVGNYAGVEDEQGNIVPGSHPWRVLGPHYWQDFARRRHRYMIMQYLQEHGGNQQATSDSA